jgi:hypothetical protein
LDPPRRHRLAPALLLALVAVLALDASRAHADPLYTITNLGQHSPDGLNNLGEVVGNVGSPIYQYQAVGDPFLYQSSGPSAGTFTDLSSVLGGSASLRAINDSGQISGDVQSPESGTRGLLYSGGPVTLVPPLTG